MTLIIVAIIVVVLISWIISVQRRLVAMDENINNAMSQIGVQLSSRFDALTALPAQLVDLGRQRGHLLEGPLEAVVVGGGLLVVIGVLMVSGLWSAAVGLLGSGGGYVPAI